MANLDYKSKMMGLTEEDGKTQIVVSHITIRQSIFFLHLRLVALEIISALGLIVFLFVIFSRNLPGDFERMIIEFNIPLFILLAVIKLSFTIFIIISWLNEYYEITPKEVVYRKGLLIKKEERHLLKHIGEVTIEQGVFGRIFNFGTLKLYNWASERNVYLYLIHNPLKYEHILEEITPDADKEKKLLRQHLVEEEEEKN